MNQNNTVDVAIRRWYTFEEETLTTESGHPADGPPLRKLAVAACIRNPYANGRHTADLGGAIQASVGLGQLIGQRILRGLRGEPLESYGKACIVGSAGEYEHGNAFLTATMMDPLRELLGGGKAWVSSTGKRGGIGTTIDVPLAHKDALYVRSHYDTMTLTFADAPNPDEIVVILAVATRGRLHARLGGLRKEEATRGDGLR